MRKVLPLILSVFALVSCTGKAKNSSYKKYTVKLLNHDGLSKLGADGLSDEEFAKISKGLGLIPGDVIIVSTGAELDSVKASIQRRNFEETYCVPVMKKRIPDFPLNSPYSYEILFKSDWDGYERINKGGIQRDFLINSNVCFSVFDIDSNPTSIPDLADYAVFNMVFDESCIEEFEVSNSLRYKISPITFLSYEPTSNK